MPGISVAIPVLLALSISIPAGYNGRRNGFRRKADEKGTRKTTVTPSSAAAAPATVSGEPIPFWPLIERPVRSGRWGSGGDPVARRPARSRHLNLGTGCARVRIVP